ncbi:PIG-L deacetylase family protein [Candidatus Riflebacteria bacterium]
MIKTNLLILAYHYLKSFVRNSPGHKTVLSITTSLKRGFLVFLKLLIIIFIVLSLFPETGNSKSLLLIAPHPDDGMISSAGLIQKKIRRGWEVFIVYLTNGENFPKAASLSLKKSPTKLEKADFLKFSRVRMSEARKATEFLGIPAKNLTFLAFPTEYIRDLFSKFRRKRLLPLKTGILHGEQQWGITKKYVKFQGKLLLKNLIEILLHIRPAILISPHPEDTHPDHKFTARFVGEALFWLLKNERPPLHLGYFVHFRSRRYYPRPFGFLPELQTPFPPVKKDYNWLRVPISYQQKSRKEYAIRFFKSQIKLNDNFLLSFVRRDELFAILRKNKPFQYVKGL